MKVLLVVHQFYPKYFFGTETYTLDLALELIKLGHDVSIVAGNPDEIPHQENLSHPENYKGIPVYYMNSGSGYGWKFQNSYLRPEFQSQFRDLLIDINPDVVHFCHLVNLGNDLIAVAKSLNKTTILSFTDFFGVCWAGNMMRCDSMACNGPAPGHWNCLADYYLKNLGDQAENKTIVKIARKTLTTGSPIFGKALKYFLSYGGVFWSETSDAIVNKVKDSFPMYHCADHIIMATRYLGEVYGANGLRKSQVSYLTYGVELPTQDQFERLDNRYHESSLSNRNIRIGFVGQLQTHKGPDLLIDAFKNANASNLELHIYGKIDQSNPFCQTLLNEAADEKRIQFCGTFQSADMYEVFTKIDVLVLPSRWHENAPLVLLNGLASKTCVIVSDGKGLTEFVSNNRNGFIFPSGNVLALTDILKSIAHDPGILNRIRNSNHGYSVSKTKYANQIQQIYHDSQKTNSDDLILQSKNLLKKKPFLSDSKGHWKNTALDASVRDSRNSWKNWINANIAEASQLQTEFLAPFPPDNICKTTTGSDSTDKEHVFFGITIMELFCEAVSQNILHSRSVLDIGFGCGRLLRLLHGNQGTIACAYGYEPMREWLKTNVPNVITKDWIDGKLDFEDAQFETILCPLEMIYAQMDSIDILYKEINRVLKKNGRAYFLYFGVKALQRFIFDKGHRRCNQFSMLNLLLIAIALKGGKSVRSQWFNFRKKNTAGKTGLNFFTTRKIHQLAENAGLKVYKDITLPVDGPYQILVLQKPDR